MRNPQNINNINILEFYQSEYPDDDLGASINPDATFFGLLEVLKSGVDFYQYIGIVDSVIRERVFLGLAQMLKADYDYVYDMWLSIEYPL